MIPVALLVHVANINEAVRWYQTAFPDALYLESPDPGVEILQIHGFQMEFVQSDRKVSSGKSGTVLYWFVQGLNEAIARFQEHGAELYRGPLQIEDGLRMCQMVDPFGNLIGLRGE